MRRKLDPTGVHRKPKGSLTNEIPDSRRNAVELDKESRANLLAFVKILMDWNRKEEKVGTDE